jgi:hypothetical protein
MIDRMMDGSVGGRSGREADADPFEGGLAVVHELFAGSDNGTPSSASPLQAVVPRRLSQTI